MRKPCPQTLLTRRHDSGALTDACTRKGPQMANPRPTPKPENLRQRKDERGHPHFLVTGEWVAPSNPGECDERGHPHFLVTGEWVAPSSPANQTTEPLGGGLVGHALEFVSEIPGITSIGPPRRWLRRCVAAPPRTRRSVCSPGPCGSGPDWPASRGRRRPAGLERWVRGLCPESC